MEQGKVTYETLILFLNNNHFYPVVQRHLKSGKIVGLQVDAVPILMGDKANRLREVLVDVPGVKIDAMRNEGFILIKFVTGKK